MSLSYSIDKNMEKCTYVQQARVWEKCSSSKLPPGKLIDVQDTGKLYKPDETGLHIDSQIGKDHKILSSKTSEACHNSNKLSLGVK